MKRMLLFILFSWLSCKNDIHPQKMVEQSVQNWVKERYPNASTNQPEGFYNFFEISNIDSINTQIFFLEGEIHLYKLQKTPPPEGLQVKLDSLHKAQKENERFVLGYNIGYSFTLTDSSGNKETKQMVFYVNKDYIVKTAKDDIPEGEEFILPRGIDVDSLKKIQHKLIEEGAQ